MYEKSLKKKESKGFLAKNLYFLKKTAGENVYKPAGLSVVFIGYGQFGSSLCTAGGQYPAAVSRRHSGTEAMLVLSFPVGGLECSFHRSI
jgi:hypothetical protein